MIPTARTHPNVGAGLPVIDAHHHLWKLGGRVRYPGLEESVGAPMTSMGGLYTIRRDYLPDEYRRDAALHNVVGTVHIEAETDHGASSLAESIWLHEISAQYGMPNAVVAHAWVDTDDAAERLAEHAALPLVRGIRTKPITASGPGETIDERRRTLRDDRWLDGLGLLVPLGLRYDLRVPWWHLQEAAEIPRRHPDLPVILEHAGCPFDRDEDSLRLWRAGLEALAAYRNVAVKISFLLTPGRPWLAEENIPLIRDVISIFGAEGCMFASNYPVDSLRSSWDRLYVTYKQAIADLPEAQQRAMLAGNAARVYDIALDDGVLEGGSVEVLS